MSIFPTISVNSDSVMKYKPNYSSFTGGAPSPQGQIGQRFAYDGHRKIILAAATNGATIDIGLYPIITTIPIAVVTFADGEPDTAIIGSGKISFSLNVPGDYNIADMFAGTISLYFDDVKVAIDDGAGKWVEYGNSGLFLPDDDPGDAWNSTIAYAGGACVVYSTEQTEFEITVSYTRDSADASTLLSVTGVAPLDLSAFLKNAPYSFHKENHDLIITPAALKATAIAYASLKG